MIYQRQNINTFSGLFDNCSTIILLGENYNLLKNDIEEISLAIAGPKASEEMRLTTYFNQEIISKKDNIISSLKEKSFFPGRSVIVLNGLPQKDFRIIFEIDAAWKNLDPITVITMDELSSNSEIRKLSGANPRVALVSYNKNEIDAEFFKRKVSSHLNFF